MAKTKAAVLISGRGSNLQSLLDAAAAPDFPAEITLVVSNRPEAGGLERARRAGVATGIIDHRQFGKGEEGRHGESGKGFRHEAFARNEHEYTCDEGFDDRQPEDHIHRAQPVAGKLGEQHVARHHDGCGNSEQVAANVALAVCPAAQ